MDGATDEGLIADKACDSDAIIADPNARGAKITILTPRSNKPMHRSAP